MEPVKWTERTFSFGYDKSYIPALVERLRTTAPRLEQLLRGCDDALMSKRTDGKWSAKEHAGHLIDLEILHSGRIDDFVSGLDRLRAADMSNAATYAANHNKASIEELLTDFTAVRSAFLRKLETTDKSVFDRRALHPRLQQMVSIADILFFTAEHDLHHLTHIAALFGKQG